MRAGLYRILEEEEPSTPLARAVEITLIVLIVLNVLAAVFETVDPVHAAFADAFRWFEAASTAVFAVEYAARLWACVENPGYSGRRWPRLRYMVSPLAVVDLIAIAPAFLGLLFVVDLLWLRMFRLLRLFKLTRHWSGLRLLHRVIRAEAAVIGAALSVFCVIIVLASGAIYVAEHEAQPEAFGSIPSAMWWAVVTLTAVGYGDVVPVTTWGRVLGGVVSLVGVGIVAFPAAILAAGFVAQIRGAGGLGGAASGDGGSGGDGERRCPHCGRPLPPG